MSTEDAQAIADAVDALGIESWAPLTDRERDVCSRALAPAPPAPIVRAA